MGMNPEIRKLVDDTLLVDTHEHLWNESTRFNTPHGQQVPPDFSMLFQQYCESDLQVAGMPQDVFQKVLHTHLDIDEKWKLFEPYYERAKQTGYLLAARRSAQILCGEDLNAKTYGIISERLIQLRKPGFYERIIREIAKVEYTQVNSFEDPIFNETDRPDLTTQDLSFVGLSSGVFKDYVEDVAQRTNREVRTLKDWHEYIDWVFETYGPRAIALKNQSAYARTLDYVPTRAEDVAATFDRMMTQPEALNANERKALEDHLFHYCLEKAAEYKLPVKLHTGYYAGHNGMPLHRVKNNMADLCPVLAAHPEVTFILMHISYPYQDEAIAVAKHYHNAVIDMCWAWIINPAAGVRFLKEMLMAAPANKVLTFGGDVFFVENIPGHVSIARQGIAQAVSELIEEGWLNGNAAPALVERIMNGNAHELFDYKGKLANWKAAVQP